MNYLLGFNCEKIKDLKVFCYFNLHKKTFSVKALEGEFKNRVIAHSDEVNLTDARPKVSEAGRQRVLKEKSKNVHAGMVGKVTSLKSENQKIVREITYNPYKYSSFVYKENEKKVSENPSNYKLKGKRVYEVE